MHKGSIFHEKNTIRGRIMRFDNKKIPNAKPHPEFRLSAVRQPQAAVAFSSLRMIEKMKSADSRHSTISTLQTIHSAMPLPQR